ncbi:Mxr1 methionine sulfoxide reductase [Candida orthopsilosis Co 90-125]|uniref:peptide-methionine (S)-S-oxide reductase n=1 Tax=Candida orthopsilosis (strain 90-125) TaxID=1136231 RepID=H8WYX1_CANO9|nr:Mxr1 methionine sulfoxide reductase [Candida orthopsilosis Co 90-125]CCG21603.1 Mxr1 methionine sulfoxide reductase [Candida orthopsilosis Co 90-125]
MTVASKVLVLGAGCFWGTEHVFAKAFANNKGLISNIVGYANGDEKYHGVSYQQVCSGGTGFVEVAKLTYDPAQLSTESIIDLFFRMHDPTQLNSQGPDVGQQYKSAIYYTDEEQHKVAEQLKEKYQKEWYPNKKIQTEIAPLKVFYDAESYHQKYLDNNPGGYECPTHFIRTEPPRQGWF